MAPPTRAEVFRRPNQYSGEANTAWIAANGVFSPGSRAAAQTAQKKRTRKQATKPTRKKTIRETTKTSPRGVEDSLPRLSSDEPVP
jgi:hypothetical protein